MSQTLTVRLDDDTYAKVLADAAWLGVSPEEWLALKIRVLSTWRSPVRSDERLTRHFGSVTSPSPLRPATNDELDAMLAESIDNHGAG